MKLHQMRRASADNQNNVDELIGALTLESATAASLLGDGDLTAESGLQIEALESNVLQIGSTLGKSLSQAQKDAIVIATAMVTNPEIARESFTHFEPVAGMQTSSRIDAKMSDHALEAFDASRVAKFKSETVKFAIGAAQQYDWAEKIFPTVAVEPNSFGYLMKLPSDEIYVSNKHSEITGNAIERKRVVTGHKDVTLLQDNSVKVYQGYRTETQSVLTDLAGTQQSIKAFGKTIVTRPILTGKEVSVLFLSAIPDLVGSSVLDDTDELDNNVAFSAAYLKITTADKDADSNAEVNGLRVDLKYNRSALFTSMANGDVASAVAATSAIAVVKADTKTTQGANFSDATGVDLTDYTVELKINLNGSINLDYGKLEPVNGTVTLNAVINSDGQALATTDAAYIAIQEALFTNGSCVVDSFDIDAKRAVGNKRTLGIQMTTTLTDHPLPIGFGAPLSEVYANKGEKKSGLEKLMQLNAMATSANAMNTIIDWYDATLAVSGSESASSNNHGAGAHYITPYAAELEVDLDTFITNDQTNRFDGAQTAVVGAVRTLVGKMLEETALTSVAKAIEGPGVKPEAIMLTMPRVASYLMTSGEDRTLGAITESSVVTNDYSVLKGPEADSAYVYVMLTVPSEANETGPLVFGNHFMMPPVVSDLPIERDNRTANELTVSPRYAHHCHLPLITRVLVKNISKGEISTVTTGE